MADDDRQLSYQQREMQRIFRNLPDPEKAADLTLERTIDGLRRNFATPITRRDPSTGLTRKLELVGDLETGPRPDVRDYGAIRDALLKGQTYGVPVRGTFRITEEDSDGNVVNVLDERKFTMARVPIPTYDRSFIVDGKKHYLAHQFRRKPGVFTRVNNAGEYISEFNLDPFTDSRIRNFKLAFQQGSGDENPQYYMEYKGPKRGSARIPAVDVYKLLGGSEGKLRRIIGDDDIVDSLMEEADDDRYADTVRNLYDIVLGEEPGPDMDLEDIEQELRDQFNQTVVDPKIMKQTVGKKVDRVNSTVFAESFRRLNKLANEEEDPDDRETLAAKRVMAPHDILAESVGHNKEIERYRKTLENNLKYDDLNVKRVVTNRLGNQLLSRLRGGSIERADDATNPLASLAAATTTTIMGEGAIGSIDAVPPESKLINPSSLAFLDPAFTPEQEKTGVTLHTTIRTKVVEDPRERSDTSTGASMLVTEVIDRSGNSQDMSPEDIEGKVVGAFDQYKMVGGRPVPKDKRVKAFRDGAVVDVPAKDVDVWLPDSTSMYSVNSALIPFVNSVQGNRVQYADKQTKQAVPLVNREAPLVQVRAPGTDTSMEEILSEELGAVRAPVAGTIKKIRETDRGRYVELQRKGSNRTVTIPLPKDLPMGGKTPLNSELRVKEGDEVQAGDLLADSNFTKDGQAALGTNLRAAYLPYHALTFEDAIAISESAAKKMTSEHLYKEAREGRSVRLGLQQYDLRGTELTSRERENLDRKTGIIKKGAIVKPGDAIMAGVDGIEFASDKHTQRAAAVGVYGTKNKYTMSQSTKPFLHTWNSPYEGEVIDVELKTKKVKDPFDKRPKTKVIGAKVLIKTKEPMEAGDKLYGRHGNKGVVSKVIPDAEMPVVDGKMEIMNPGGSKFIKGQEISQDEYEEAKKLYPDLEAEPARLEIMLNPLGVPGRINPSQNFETFLAKIARQKGGKELVENFGYESNWDYVKDRLKQEGLSDTETVVDPMTGKRLGQIGVGTQYFLKAKQTVSSKNTARGVGHWDQRTGLALKGDDGAQSLGELGVFGLLSQNAREFLRDSQIHRSEAREEVWNAVRNGRKIPQHLFKQNEETKALTRLFQYMRAAGVTPEHDPSRSMYELRPLTDDDVLKLTESQVGWGNQKSRVLESPYETFKAKADLGEADFGHKGGLFDPKITSGPDGKYWTRFELPNRMPNPVFEKAITNLLDLKQNQFKAIMRGEQGVKIGESTFHGSEAIEKMLENVDLDKRFEESSKVASSHRKASERSKAHRTMRSINMLKKNEISPVDAFMRKQVAVIPYNMRSVHVDQDDRFQIGDINYLYRDVALTAEELKAAKNRNLPPKALGHIEDGMYETLRTLMQVEGSKPIADSYKGVLGTLTGAAPAGSQSRGSHKNSLFKRQVFQRRQAFSGRAVISPDDQLALDEIGIPRPMAATIGELQVEAAWRKDNPEDVDPTGEKSREFRRKLKEFQKTGQSDPDVDYYLDKAFSDQHVVVKRDPVLHKYGVQGFKPRLITDNIMKVNPLVYGGFNADNDGDQMAVFMPMSQEANEEIKTKLLPSKNLFNPSSGSLEYTLGHEAVLGLARMTREPLTRKVQASFRTQKDAFDAYEEGQIKLNSHVEVQGEKTTVGRMMFNRRLPVGTDLDTLVKDGVVDRKALQTGLSAGDLRGVLEHVAVNHTPAFGEVANQLRSEGQKQATMSGVSLTLDDLKPLMQSERRQLDINMRQEIQRIRRNPLLSEDKKKEKINELFLNTIGDLDKKAEQHWRKTMKSERPNAAAEMVFSGARAKMGQLAQLSVAPVGLIDGRNNLVEVPVMRNYSEGLDAADTWTAMAGARQGAISKTIQVKEPGHLTKLVVNTAIDQVITEEDCGTTKGVQVDLSDPQNKNDIIGRVLARPVETKNVHLDAGQFLSVNNVSQLQRDTRKTKLTVRSPLTCESKNGVCQKCAGGDKTGQFKDIGENIGVQAAQSIGERSTQLALSTFHHGGRHSAQGTARDLYQEAQFLLKMPSSNRGVKRALVAPEDVEVDKVKLNKRRGGWEVQTKGDDKPNLFIPRKFRPPGEVIEQAKREQGKEYKEMKDWLTPGTHLKRGQPITDGVANPKDILETTGSIHETQNYMVNRLNDLFRSEGVARRNIETVVRSMTSTVEVEDGGSTPYLPGHRMSIQQAEDEKKRDSKFKFRPVLKGVDIAPREMREDFLSRLNSDYLRQGIEEMAQVGAQSRYHSTNPVPALAVGREFNRPPPSQQGTGVY